MKKIISLMFVSVVAVVMAGCTSSQTDMGMTNQSPNTTNNVSQQLANLERAKNNGTISEIQYQEEKSRLVNTK